MFTLTRAKNITFLFVACLLLLSLAGCGSSAYAKAISPAIEQFNTAANTVTKQVNALTANNALFEDATWKSETSTALSNWKGTAEGLTNLPKPEEKYAQLDSLVKEMASQAILAVDTCNAAIQAGDATQLNKANQYLDRVNELLPQINTEIDRLNQ